MWSGAGSNCRPSAFRCSRRPAPGTLQQRRRLPTCASGRGWSGLVAVVAVSSPGIRRQAGSSTGLQPGSRGGSARRSRTPAASDPAVPVAKLSCPPHCLQRELPAARSVKVAGNGAGTQLDWADEEHSARFAREGPLTLGFGSRSFSSLSGALRPHVPSTCPAGPMASCSQSHSASRP